ncbi:hypothetical protein TVAG_006020 [Trichomonas vaginalis G3]|uniref:V-type proton ATPase subunit n=1 Tax=Trichomonas vaginalis (strain ATCC PRA-98 / G3) TaxID=412133 RepID=A2E709_TRIV3|nr:proton-exporting ATPase activity, phosphorylative mechanism [Trichomonas vaginalis G3]EAY11527.1 hypothetical protein TVAG_006020 [Trichomonas vaginalis G3]KAI5489411.1 proton-exporting ATPase activity, phosphorylative mechanism [Trichomonas vaginalis G3]|eukprot:XP_001323750.1 hypothetical protein [Trichomonas vaginalis G3]
MDNLHYNIRYGFLDGYVRACFTEFLTEADYMQLKQCETLEDFRLHLSNAGFQSYLQNDAGTASPTVIYERCLERLVDKFNYVESQASDELKTFFQWLRIPFMIDNVIIIISGVVHDHDVTELIERCHPLGMFDGIKALAVASTVQDLYQMVLVDTPLGPLFSKCLNTNSLSEQNVESIRLKLYREYYDQFYEFCKNLGSETALVMCDLLEFEADRRAIIITLNSIRTSMIADDREALYPRIGQLATITSKLAAKGAGETTLADALQPFETYKKLFDLSRTSSKTIEEVFLERAALMHVESFSVFFSFAVFYSWVQLMDQEVRNIQWIAECIHQGKRDRADSYVRIAP